ncbi:MAG: caspase family protein [Vulcanibacillus sp.]
MSNYYLILSKSSITILLLIAHVVFLPISSYSQVLPLETIIQQGHTEYINSIDYSPDGKYILTGSGDKTAILWEIETGKQIRTFSGHKSCINSAKFSPNSEYILTGSRDKTAILWEIDTGKKIKIFNDFKEKIYVLYKAAFTPDGKNVVIGTSSKIFIFDIKSSQIVKTIPVKTSTFSISPDGRFLAVVSEIGNINNINRKSYRIVLREIKSGKIYKTFKEQSAIINSVCFSPDGKSISTGSGTFGNFSDNYSIKLWNIDNEKENKLFIGHSSEINSIAFSQNGKYLASSSLSNHYTTDNSVRLWDIDTGKQLQVFNSEVKIKSVCFSPCGGNIVIGMLNGGLKLWNINEWKEIKIIKGNAFNVNSVDISKDGRVFAIGSGNRMALWDIDANKVKIISDSTNFLSIALHPNGKNIASCSGYIGKDNCAKIWDIKTGKITRVFEDKDTPSWYFSLDFSPDGEHLVTGGNDDLAEIWSSKTGNKIKAFKGHSDNIKSVCFSPDGNYIFTTSSDRTARLWDVNNGKELKSYNNKCNDDKYPSPARDAVFNSDGKYIVTGGSIGALLFKISSSNSIKEYKRESHFVNSVCFSPGGEFLITGGQDNAVVLWNVNTGNEIKVFNGHSGDINSVIFHPNGKLFLSASDDGTTKLWDISSGEELATLISVGENDWVVTTPDGFFDTSEGGKNSVHFVKGLEVYELDQFFEEFYRPGLLAEVMSGEKSNRPDITIEDKLLGSPPPNVEIISPQIDQKFTNQTIKVEIKAINTGGGIDEVKLLHNGKRVAGESRGIKIKSTNKEIYETFNISLVKGDNELIASAFSKGRIESKGYKINISYNGPSKIATSYILAIGINEYKNKQLNLNYAKSDAEAFVKIVSSKSHNLFDKIEIITLYDIEANMTNILNALDDIAQKAKPEDVFTFFYAGHGSVIDNRYYIVTSENIKLYDREKLDKNALYIKMLQDKLSDIKALKQLVVMDACQSGAATEMLALRGAAEEKALAQLGRSAGVHVFASSGSDQFASEFNELKHGVFTYVLLEALQGKADGSPKDGKVTINELKSYIEDQVPVQTEKYKGETQYPTTVSKGQDFPVILIK